MAATDYQQWVKVAKELGYEGEDLRKFVSERQTEMREDRAREREEKKASDLREIEEGKRRAEEDREKRQIEEDREKRQVEEDREKRQMELELKKLESEIRMKEVEARMTFDIRQTEEQRRTDVGDYQPVIPGSRNQGIQNIKFPTFNENKDCLDAYLLRFERTCEAFEIPQKLWPLTLARHLEGKALEVYQRLTPLEAQEYTCLKEQLLKRFQLTEGGYRRKFKESRMEPGETPSQFVERLRRYLKQWILLAGHKETYEGLQNLILRDQFFITCPTDLRIFIKEKGKTDLVEMLTHAESYIDAHGYRYSETNSKPKLRFTQEKDQNKASVERKDTFTNATSRYKAETESHGEMNRNKFTSRDFGKERMQNAEPRPICYICKAMGHKSFQCPNKSQGFSKHTAAAIQVFENSLLKAKNEQVGSAVTREQEVVDRQETQGGRDASDNMVASAMIVSRYRGDPLDPNCVASAHHVRVNGQNVECLFDSGATCCVVERRLVDESDLTGKETWCTLIDGSTRHFPTAHIDVESEYFTGRVEALVMEKPVKPVIIGNIHGIKFLLSKDKDYVEETDSKTDTIGDNLTQHEESVDLENEGEDHKAVDEDSSREEQRPATPTCRQLTADRVTEFEHNVTMSHDASRGCEPLAIAAMETRASSNRVERYSPLKTIELPNIEISPQEIQKMQEQDDTLKKYRELANLCTDEDDRTDKIHFVFKNNLLYRRYREVSRGEVRLQLVVPQPLREKVMTIAHCSLLAAHLGIKKTLSKISTDFYWPSINQDIRRFVLSCDICQRTVDKKVNYKAPLGHLPVVDVPFACICIDLIGPMNPMSSRGHRYVLTVIDLSTRYPEAIPLKGITTEEVAEALFGLYCRMGVPQRIHTDRGSQFTSDLMAEVNKMLLVKHTLTTPYHAMGNGCVERLNGTIKATLRKLICEQPKEWDRYLAPLLFALRDAVHESHGFTPFELVFGRSCRGPIKILKELWTNEVVEEEVKDAYNYMLELRERIDETCALAQKAISQSQAKNKKYYDKKARNRKLEIGDKALLLLPKSNNKLLLQWQGPYVVKDKVGEHDYRIEMEGGKVKTFHINMLKKYFDRKDIVDVAPDVDKKEACETETAAYISAVVHDGESGTDGDGEILDLYNSKQKETYKDVDINPELNGRQKAELLRLLEEYGDIFSDVPGKTDLVEHEIVVTSTEPIRSKAYPTPYHLQKEIDKEIEVMLSNGIIERSESAYAAPLVVVKKSDGSNRLCCNYKQLNKVTVFDPEPMMSNEEVFNKLSGSQVYSKFDFSKGYWQIPMAENSRDMTTFICANGMFKFNVMPFGLVNSASSYNRLIRKILYGTKNLESYVDDVLAHTRGWDEHLRTLKDFFDRVRKARLTLKPKKCSLGYNKIDFLGHTLRGNDVSPKVESCR